MKFKNASKKAQQPIVPKVVSYVPKIDPVEPNIPIPADGPEKEEPKKEELGGKLKCSTTMKTKDGIFNSVNG